MPFWFSAIFFPQFPLETVGFDLTLLKMGIALIVKAPGSWKEMNDRVRIWPVEISFEHHSQIRSRKLIFLVGYGALLGCEMESVLSEKRSSLACVLPR